MYACCFEILAILSSFLTGEIIQNVTCITRIATPKAADIVVDKWPGLSNFTP